MASSSLSRSTARVSLMRPRHLSPSFLFTQANSRGGFTQANSRVGPESVAKLKPL